MKKLIAVLISLMLLCGAALPALAEGAAKARKDETVYILAGADGSANRIIVSDHLSNPSGAATLEDVSNLEDIENVKGEQTFENGVWQAEGEDIYYQGAGKTPLPVELKMSYSLNGEELAPEDMAGKDGLAALDTGVEQLADGVQRLLNGAQALKNGLELFSDEGVAKLDKLVSEDMEQLLNRVRELILAAQSSQNYSGMADGMDASLRFIWRTDAIEG